MHFTWLVSLLGSSIGGIVVLSAKSRTRLPKQPRDNIALGYVTLMFNVNYEQ